MVLKNVLKKVFLYFRKKYYIIKIRFKLKFSKKLSLKPDNNELESLCSSNNVSCYLTKNRKFKNEIDLSIIVPLYNSEKFIDNLVYTLINQKTKYTYEVILVNDGSLDNTLSIANKYMKKYPNTIKVINQKNGGISIARNTGLAKAIGKYIGFIDHDDYISDNYIDKLLILAYENNADIVKCGIGNTKNGKVFEKKFLPFEIIEGKMKEKILDYQSFIWAGIYKSELFEDLIFPEHYWYEDMITRFVLYRRSNKFVNTSDVMYFRIFHDNQASNKVWSNKDYRCLQQLYLIESLVSDNNNFSLENDIYLYLNVLLECSNIMVQRIDKIDNSIKKYVFLRVNSLLKQIYKDEYSKMINKKWKLKSDIILNLKYDAWQDEKYL